MKNQVYDPTETEPVAWMYLPLERTGLPGLCRLLQAIRSYYNKLVPHSV